MLFPARYFDSKPGFGQPLLDLERNRIDLSAILAAQFCKLVCDGLVSFRLELLEGKQLHLAHIFIHAHTLCQRGVDIHRLTRDPLAFFRAFDEMQRAHVVQSVCQLDEQDADVL